MCNQAIQGLLCLSEFNFRSHSYSSGITGNDEYGETQVPVSSASDSIAKTVDKFEDYGVVRTTFASSSYRTLFCSTSSAFIRPQETSQV